MTVLNIRRHRVASSLETEFDNLWRVIGGPTLEAEQTFDTAGRLWRFDRCHRASRVAIELDGAVYQQGRHTRGAGYIEDCTKLNRATELGWRVFRLTASHLHDDPIGNLTAIKNAILETANKA